MDTKFHCNNYILAKATNKKVNKKKHENYIEKKSSCLMDTSFVTVLILPFVITCSFAKIFLIRIYC